MEFYMVLILISISICYLDFKFSSKDKKDEDKKDEDGKISNIAIGIILLLFFIIVLWLISCLRILI